MESTAQQGYGQSYGRGISFVLLATLGWSLSGLFVRFMPELDGWQINCWRGFWTFTSLLCFLVSQYGMEAFSHFRRIPPVALLLSAGFFAFGSTMYVISLTLASVAVVSVIGATSPLFTGLFSPWVTGERPGIASWVAVFLAVAGMAVIGWEKLEGGHLGVLLVCLLVPFCFASQTLTLRRYSNIDMVPAICFGGLVSFLGAGFVGFFFHSGGGFAVSFKGVALLALMAVVQLAIPLVFYARGARSVPAVTLSLIAMLDAVLNPLWPWLVVGEIPERSAFIGGAVIVFAVLISIFGGKIFSGANT
jgi:drug/metabolite transporter (DMT)-like permease